MKPENSSDDLTWLLGACGLLVFIGLHKLWPLLEKPEVRLFVASICGVVAMALIVLLTSYVSKKRAHNKKDDQIISKMEGDSVFAGWDNANRNVFIKTKQRSMHTQVVGTTNAGKTESIILPWAIQDIQQKRGLILIDGKSERGLLDKLWAYTKQAGRAEDFRLFSLSLPEKSHQFNPLMGGSPEEISERVFNSFEFENPHYRSLQFDLFSQVMRIFTQAEVIPTFGRIRNVIEQPDDLVSIAHKTDESLRQWAIKFRQLANFEREQRTSGLTAALSHFSFGKPADLFNTEQPHFTMEEALEKNLIIYFQLPVLLTPFLGKATGKLVLQCLQSAVANRHRGGTKSKQFYSVFLDDFAEYIYPGFVSILNKSRSANIGIVFAHQALGDLKTLGDAVANSILTNSNLKIFMRGNDPESAEYFSQVIGTQTGTKYTERKKIGVFQNTSTGDASARDVEEFIVHPNRFKRDLGVGEAMMLIPHERGTLPLKMRFKPFPDLRQETLPDILKTPALTAVNKSKLPSESSENPLEKLVSQES